MFVLLCSSSHFLGLQYFAQNLESTWFLAGARACHCTRCYLAYERQVVLGWPEVEAIDDDHHRLEQPLSKGRAFLVAPDRELCEKAPVVDSAGGFQHRGYTGWRARGAANSEGGSVPWIFILPHAPMANQLTASARHGGKPIPPERGVPRTHPSSLRVTDRCTFEGLHPAPPSIAQSWV